MSFNLLSRQRSKLLYFSTGLFLPFLLLTIAVSAHTSEQKNTVIIHVNQTGYVPKTITIEPNTTVLFENIGTELHWPASDDHPSHTHYDGTTLEEHCTAEHSPTFDSCQGIASGETWSFTFEKSGTFQYHDHLWPHLGGEIIVQEKTFPKKENANIFTQFLNFLRKLLPTQLILGENEKNPLPESIDQPDNRHETLKTKYRNLVLESDPRIAIQKLQEESLKNNDVSALCHDVLHEIGHTAYQKYGTFKDSVAFQSDFCNSGYIHGIFESYFESAEDPLSGLAEQCNAYAKIGGRQFDFWQCHHGIGHGFMYLTGGDLDASLALCAESLAGEAIISCQNGVYMEVFNQEILAKEPEFINPDNPFSTCLVRNTAKSDCYLYVPTYFFQTLELDFPEIFRKCTATEPGYKRACVSGVASEATKRNMNTPEFVFSLCKQAGTLTDQEACVSSVVIMYMNQSGSAESGETLCNSAPKEYFTLCEKTAENRAPFFE